MSRTRSNTFKVVQLNAENLFLFLNDTTDRDWRRMNEKEWQKMSTATVPNKSLVKTLWLADSLLDMDADIVCINEVGGQESLANFAKLFLKGRYAPHLLEGNSDRGIDVGFLVHKDFLARTELRTHKDRPLDFLYPHERETNMYFEGLEPERGLKTHYFSRDCAELRLYREGSDRPALIVLCVHLKSKLDPDGIDPEGRQRREAEVKTLIKIYRELRAEFSPPVPIVISGDFNGCAKRSALAEEFAELANTDLESVLDIAGVDGDAAATQLQFHRGGGLSCLQIDFIFISPELKPELAGAEVFRYLSDLKVPLPIPKTLDQRTYLPSDHYPVVATFKNFLK
jgi:endonuclease/exonuclease/phosphatase family metal-dependent hydrolase